MKWIHREPEPRVVDDAEPPSAEEISRELERLNHHPIFRKSENLRSILTYLVERSIESPGVNHKEHEIATSALGRPDDFDPRLDSTVRVHTARLRTKLAEYYASDGEQDEVVFEIPKGAYQLNARRSSGVRTALPEEDAAETARPQSRVSWLGWAVAAASCAFSVWVWTAGQDRALSPALRQFWADFLRPGEENALVFSPPRMTGSAFEGLRFAQSDQVAAGKLIEDYTGTGEVYGIGALAGLFGQSGKPIRIKRGRLLTWDDARQQNLVFIGGPGVNLHLGELPGLERFRFDTTANGSFLYDSLIKDAFPGQHRSQYGNSGRPYTYDHAVIARMRLASNRRMLLLAGTTTVGTQAAVDFVVKDETARALLGALKLGPGAAIPPFEALLAVKVNDGVPVHSQIIAVHLRK